MIKNFLIPIALMTSILVNAQSTYELGILPSLNLSKGLEHGYKVSFKLESRQLFKEGFIAMQNDFDHQYVLTDLTTMVAKKVATNKSVALGYLFRLKAGKVLHRGLQQYATTKRYTGFQMSHRFLMDQTFGDSFKTLYRLRYRIGAEIPLSGDKVDPKEPYFKIYHEYVNGLQAGVYDLEVRLCPFIGYVFTSKRKLQFGLDYRIKSFVNDSTFNRFFIGINWFQAF
ncbi:DUF2490 domain-containing protein [Maribacter polysaccharolyticus]|uniref:DUF2490 domain-containing protein n=1 Tax=Maribacter polysaccharolyticus TaxID=3020831 RepID=UPI00237F142C|nr:DUF2490 domain-containing protein [Maribacter polysaccharolyticus]